MERSGSGLLRLIVAIWLRVTAEFHMTAVARLVLACNGELTPCGCLSVTLRDDLGPFTQAVTWQLFAARVGQLRQVRG